MGLSLHSKMHQCLTLFPVLFLQSLYVPLNSVNFPFTCVIWNYILQVNGIRGIVEKEQETRSDIGTSWSEETSPHHTA